MIGLFMVILPFKSGSFVASDQFLWKSRTRSETYATTRYGCETQQEPVVETKSSRAMFLSQPPTRIRVAWGQNSPPPPRLIRITYNRRLMAVCPDGPIGTQKPFTSQQHGTGSGKCGMRRLAQVHHKLLCCSGVHFGAVRKARAVAPRPATPHLWHHSRNRSRG